MNVNCIYLVFFFFLDIPVIYGDKSDLSPYIISSRFNLFRHACKKCASLANTGVYVLHVSAPYSGYLSKTNTSIPQTVMPAFMIWWSSPLYHQIIKVGVEVKVSDGWVWNTKNHSWIQITMRTSQYGPWCNLSNVNWTIEYITHQETEF